MGTDPAKNVAGPVVMSLGMICIALFATAATIIRQIIHTYNTVVLYALPVLGYLAALLTFICGWEYISEAATASHFVAGHVICGVAFITACVATTATSSTRFTLIPANSQTTENDVPPQAFNGTQGKLLIVVAALLALATWIWTFQLLAKSDVHNAYYVAGHVMAGIACICTSLVALVATMVACNGTCHGNTQHPLGATDTEKPEPCRIFHRVYNDRPGIGLLQHFKQSHTPGSNMAQHFQTGKPNSLDTRIYRTTLSVPVCFPF
jgi:hypothetical protein